MLKWTVSRSLSATSSTPHGPPTLNKAPRRPFRDLSNTPPTSASCRTRQVSTQNVSNTSRTTPARRRRCRSHGTDLRTYFQVIVSLIFFSLIKVRCNKSLNSNIIIFEEECNNFVTLQYYRNYINIIKNINSCDLSHALIASISSLSRNVFHDVFCRRRSRI